MSYAQNESTDVTTGKTTVELVPWTAELLSAYLADVRYQHEVAGITVAGLPISTDRGNERTTWQNLMLQSQANPLFQIRKKLDGKFVSLTAAQITQCGTLGAGYIAACFAVEDQLLQRIEKATSAADLDAIETAINDASTWPNRVYGW